MVSLARRPSALKSFGSEVQPTVTPSRAESNTDAFMTFCSFTPRQRSGTGIRCTPHTTLPILRVNTEALSLEREGDTTSIILRDQVGRQRAIRATRSWGLPGIGDIAKRK